MLWNQLLQVDWGSIVAEIAREAIGVIVGVAVSWFVLFRKRLKYFDRLRRGDSDELIFQAHYLLPVDADGAVQLLFRNVGPRTTVDAAYDNPAARNTLRTLCKRTTFNQPIVPTDGRSGYEILNDSKAIVDIRLRHRDQTVAELRPE